MELLAESWLLPQEDTTLVLSGDGRSAQTWVGRQTQPLPRWAGVFRHLQNAEQPCRGLVSHRAVPGPQGLDAGKGLSRTHSNQRVSKATALRKEKELRNPSLEWETALRGE